MAKLKVGDKVENIFAAEDGEEDRFRYGVVHEIFFNRDGEEMIDVKYPGDYISDIREEYLRPDTRNEQGA